jgi:hypothetical protein
MEGATGMRLLFVGSWTRVLITAAVLVLLFAAFAWLAVSGQLGELRYLNVPLLHPYPPAGYVQNPFNPGDKGDLISISEAARVRADLLRDGEIEVVAAEKGDVGTLSSGVTGRALQRFTALIQQNNAQDVAERTVNRFDSVVAGRLSDPNDANIGWAAKETGTATLTFTSKSSGAITRQERVRFTSTFWLVRMGDQYLIADSLIQTTPIQ